MKSNFTTSWPQRRHGVTLVEAVVGTALLGSLLVGILLADSRQRRQTWRGERRIKACAIADELLETSQRIVGGMMVDEAAIQRNLNQYGHIISSERVLMALVKSGADRQVMHERLRELALQTREDAGGGDPPGFYQLVTGDPLFHANPQLRHGVPETIDAFVEVKISNRLVAAEDRWLVRTALFEVSVNEYGSGIEPLGKLDCTHTVSFH